MTVSLAELERRVEALWESGAKSPAGADTEATVSALLDALERGEVRAAVHGGGEGAQWTAVPWVKRGILCAFRVGEVREMAPAPGAAFPFFDKHTLPVRTYALGDGVRLVPGGSSERRGAYLAPGVVCMPPMYVNVGAHVGAGTMIDSHALVGSCAQVGERVHLSAAAQIGGVLEPVNAAPVVIEDDVIVGGNTGVFEGTVVREGAVLAAGVVLTRGTPVYDLVRETIHRATPGSPLVIPPRAVVVPGARNVKGGWAAAHGLALQAPVIVKYRDEKTDLSTMLEQWLR